jgi:aminoglycoside phosphotransferase (APT) family kinase protein
MESASIPRPPAWRSIVQAARTAGFDKMNRDGPALRWNEAPDRHWWGHLNHKYRFYAYPANSLPSHENPALLEAVAQALEPLGYEVPRIVASFAAPSPRGVFNIVARTHVKGTTFISRLENMPDEQLAKTYYEFGQLLGHIHSKVPVDAAPKQLHPWNHMLPAQPSKQQMNAFACFLSFTQQHVKSWSAFMEQTAPDFNALCGEPVFCHGDYNEQNVLLRKGVVKAPLDFEMANQAPRALDFAHATLPSEDLPSFLAGYTSVTNIPVTISQVTAARIRSVMYQASLGDLYPGQTRENLAWLARTWFMRNEKDPVERIIMMNKLGLRLDFD